MTLISLFALICRYLFVHLQAHEARQGHSYCSQQGCERIKIMAQMYPGGSWSCAPNPFSQRPAAPQRPMSQHKAVPCRACGAPQVRAPLLQPYVASEVMQHVCVSKERPLVNLATCEPVSHVEGRI